MSAKAFQLLLVEDDDELRSAMAEGLAERGFDVSERRTAKRRLRVLDAGHPRLFSST